MCIFKYRVQVGAHLTQLTLKFDLFGFDLFDLLLVLTQTTMDFL